MLAQGQGAGCPREGLASRAGGGRVGYPPEAARGASLQEECPLPHHTRTLGHLPVTGKSKV